MCRDGAGCPDGQDCDDGECVPAEDEDGTTVDAGIQDLADDAAADLDAEP